MVTLGDIRKGGTKYPPRIVAHGVDGIGKSTFGSQAEKPIFICTEDGATRLDVPQFPLCEKWEDVFDCLRVLAKEKHDYKTCVVDTADWAEHLAMDYIIREEYDGDGTKFDAYGAGYKVLIRELRKFMVALDYLRIKRQMLTILLIHTSIKTFKNPLGENYDVFKASLVDSQSTSIWGALKQWADIVLFMNFDIKVKTDSAKAVKGKATMMQKRYIYTKPSAAYDAKVRAGWDLPDKIELDYEIFKAQLNKSKTAPKTEE